MVVFLNKDSICKKHIKPGCFFKQKNFIDFYANMWYTELNYINNVDLLIIRQETDK